MRMTFVTMAVLLAGAPMAANWPQWRGWGSAVTTALDYAPHRTSRQCE